MELTKIGNDFFIHGRPAEFDPSLKDHTYTVRGKLAVSSGFLTRSDQTIYQWCQVFDGKKYRDQLINQVNLNAARKEKEMAARTSS